jgi:hypothetical protein
MRATASLGKIERPIETGLCRLSFDGHPCGIGILVDLLTCLIDSIVHPSLSGEGCGRRRPNGSPPVPPCISS